MDAGTGAPLPPQVPQPEQPGEYFCPTCGGANPAGTTTCQWCHTTFDLQAATPHIEQVAPADTTPRPPGSGAVPTSGRGRLRIAGNVLGGVREVLQDLACLARCCSMFGVLAIAVAGAAFLVRGRIARRAGAAV